MRIPRNANDCRKAKRALRIEIGWRYAPLDFDGAALTRVDPERFDAACDRLAAWLIHAGGAPAPPVAPAHEKG